MSRLPQPGADSGTWGEILNDFLAVEHNSDGTLKSSGSLASKEPIIPSGTTSQYFRGDKTFQTLDKAVVGLASVDNTSDANKPISSAAQTALNTKADDSAVVHKATNETITGIKTFDPGMFVDKGSEVFNVKAFGAVGDGVADDHDAIMNAISAAASAGGTVLLPAGDYKLGQTLTPTTYGVRLTGASPRGLRGNNTPGGARLIASGNFDVLGGFWESCIISHLGIDAQGHGGMGIHAHLNKSIIEYCEITGYIGYGVLLNDGVYSTDLGFVNKFQHNNIDSSNGVGLSVKYRWTDSWILSNNIGSTSANLMLEGGPHKIIGNHLDGGGLGSGPEYNIYCDAVGDTILINGNLLENARKHAVNLIRPPWETGNRQAHISITSNILRDGGFEDPSSSAIRVKGNVGSDTGTLGGVVVTGNTIYNAYGTWTRAVQLDHVNTAALTGNDWRAGHSAAEPVETITSANIEAVGNGADNNIVSS